MYAKYEDSAIMDHRRRFAAKLKRICEAQGWTVERLAREAGMSGNAVRDLIDVRHTPSRRTILALLALESRLEGER